MSGLREMGDTKIKINIKEGTFEIEGSESFVMQYWEKLKTSLESLPPMMPIISKEPHTIVSKIKSKSKKSFKKTQSNIKKESMSLIPLDLKGVGNTPSFKQFYQQKSPKSHREIITLMAYYLKKYLKIENMKYGHALFCYGETGKAKPLNISSLFSDVSYHHKWLETGSEPYSAKLTIAGENLIEHDLPRTKQK